MGAQIVDSIIADLDIRYQKYVAGFDKATAAHERFTRSVPKIGAMGGFTEAEAQQYANRHAKAGADVVKSEEATSARVVRVRRARTAELRRTDEAEVASAKAAAKAKADAEIAEAQRSARLRGAVDRGLARQAANNAPGSGRNIGATVPRVVSGQASIPLNVLNGPAREEAVVENEINHLLADRAVLQSRLTLARGTERQIIRDQLTELALADRLQKAGLDDEAIAIRLAERRLLVERQRAATMRGQVAKGAEQFARGAGFNAATGGGAAIAGIATVAAVAIGAEVIGSAVEYGKALSNLSKQLGITVTDLQAYEHIARDTGVSTEQLTSAFGQFASNLGRAQQGSQEQAKVFKALGVDIKDFASAGDALPTVIDRISQISDPAKRAALETRLFGEEGRRLDPLLAGGAAAVSGLAKSLQETGRSLSAKEIQELDDTARKLADVKNQLAVDFARIVAGNASAIIGLASSFGILAGKIVETIGRLQQFGAERIRASGLASSSDKAVARQYLLGTPGGRQSLFTENTNQINDIRRKYGARPGDNALSSTTINGLPATVRQINRARRNAELTPLLAERAEIRAANQSATVPTPPVDAGTVNNRLLNSLGAPKPPKGRKGKSAEQIEREAEGRTKQFNDQIAAATADYLRAQQQLTGSTDKRAAIDLELLDAAYKARLDDIDSNRKRNVLAGADAKLEDARADELKAAEKKARDAQATAIEQDRQLENARAMTALTDSMLDVENTLLSAQAALATTVKDRRRILLQIVDNEQARETNRLNGIIASSKPGSPEQKEAQGRLDRVPEIFGAQRAGVIDQTLSPLEQYRKDLHSATDDTTAAIEGIEINALQGLEDSISRSIGKVLGLKGAFGELFSSILTDIARLEIKKGILSLLGLGSSGGIGGKVGALLSKGNGITPVVSLPGRASGGHVVGGSSYLVGENGPEEVVFGSSGKVYSDRGRPSTPSASHSPTTVIQHFTLDARGGVVTEDLIRYTNEVGRAAALEGAKGGANAVFDTIGRPRL